MDTITAGFRAVKNFLKRNWGIILTVFGLVAVTVATAVAFPGFFPAVAQRLVEMSRSVVTSISNFFGRIFKDIAIPVRELQPGETTIANPGEIVVMEPTQPVTIVVTPNFA